MIVQITTAISLLGLLFTPIADDPAPEDPIEDNAVQIVFTSNRGDNPEVLDLYLLDLESGDITSLETGSEAPAIPQWSPDRTKVLFSVREIWNLYTVDVDGGEITQITDFRSNNGA